MTVEEINKVMSFLTMPEIQGTRIELASVANKRIFTLYSEREEFDGLYFSYIIEPGTRFKFCFVVQPEMLHKPEDVVILVLNAVKAYEKHRYIA